MLVIALIAVCLGVLVEIPGLGVVLLLVSTPALIRTLMAVSRGKAAGRPLSGWEKMTVFAGSLGVVAVIGLASLIAFIATCFPVGLISVQADMGVGVFLAFSVGIIAAGFVGFTLIRKLWPQRAP
jgi:hypothetical protein